MTTTTLQLKVQRGRFAHHALTALAGLIPSALRSGATRVTTPLSISEAASLEAAKVRELAYQYSKTDPGFASDLYAAASRHEALHAD